jgi:hypothetical protein
MLRLAAASLVVLLGACGPPVDGPALDLPERPADAPGAQELIPELRGLDVEGREERIFREVARGNVPSWIRRLEPVELSTEVRGRSVGVAFWTMPDYLAIGSDDDYFYVPLSPGTAQRIADHVGGSLPTPAMVDAVWGAARARLTPVRLALDEDVATMRYFERHNALVRAQRRQHRARPGVFVAGHKLDVVVGASPGGGAAGFGIYGWHHRDGTLIQPLYPFPRDGAPHFSMGVRLVHRRVEVDGQERDLAELLRDPRLAPLLGAG